MNARLLGFSGLVQSPSIHPAIAHFPVVLLPLSLLLVGAGQLTGKPGVRIAGRACLWLALVAAVVAILTGSKAVNGLPRDPAVWELLRVHRVLAFVFTFVTTALAGWSASYEKSGRKAEWLFLGALAFDCLLAFQAGDLGARMVYLHGAGTKLAPPVAPERRPGKF